MKELIWVNEDNEVVGYGEKIHTHVIEQLHRAFSIFIVDQDGNMLIQRRAKGKYHSGGLLSNACCSHPYRNEKWNDALSRCIYDELGVEVSFHDLVLNKERIDDALDFCGAFIYYSKYDDLSEHEYDHVFIYHCDNTFKERIQLNPDEIESIEWMSISKLEEMLKDQSLFTTWFPLAYEQTKRL